MKKALILLSVALFVGCMNKVEVPAKIEQCFKDPQTGECTNQVQVEVRHIITIELPTVFTDQCKAEFNEVDFPDPVIREAGYQQCVTNYINQLLSLVNSLTPDQVQQTSPQ